MNSIGTIFCAPQPDKTFHLTDTNTITENVAVAGVESNYRLLIQQAI